MWRKDEEKVPYDEDWKSFKKKHAQFKADIKLTNHKKKQIDAKNIEEGKNEFPKGINFDTQHLTPTTKKMKYKIM